jgi:2'-5' RNA ligase
VPAAKAERELAAVLEEFSAFSVHLHEVCVFPATDVLYISVAGGAGELTRLHSTTNRKGVHFADPYAFHPHVTLAQETAPGGVAEARLHATRRWSSYAGPRDFLLDKLFLVECRSSNEFVDAAAFTLRVPLAMGVGGR